MVVFLVVAVAAFWGSYAYTSYRHFTRCDTFEAWVDVLITVANYVGTILVANGVVLALKDVDALKKHPGRPTKRIQHIIQALFAASWWARIGIWVLTVAFVLDVGHKAFMMAASANTCH